MKIFPATEAFFDESEWRSYHEGLVPELEALGLEVLECSAGHALPLVPLCDKLLDHDARTAIFPALGALMEALCSRSILLCDRVLVMLDGDDDHRIIDQVNEAAKQGKPMDGYLTDYRRSPWDEHDPFSREITALIARSGGVIASSLDELLLVYVRHLGLDQAQVRAKRDVRWVPPAHSTLAVWPGPKAARRSMAAGR